MIPSVSWFSDKWTSLPVERFTGTIDHRNVFLHHRRPEEVFFKKKSLVSQCLARLFRKVLGNKEIRKGCYWIFKKHIDVKIANLTCELLDRKICEDQISKLDLDKFDWLKSIPIQSSAQAMRVHVLQETVGHLKEQGICALVNEQFWQDSDRIRKEMPEIIEKCFRYLRYKEEHPQLQSLYALAKKIDRLFLKTFEKEANIPTCKDQEELSCIAYIRSQSIKNIVSGELDALVNEKLRDWDTDSLPALVYALFSTSCLAKWNRPELAKHFKNKDTLVAWIRSEYPALKKDLQDQLKKGSLQPDDPLPQQGVRPCVSSSSGKKQEKSTTLVSVVRGGGLFHMLDFFAGRSPGTLFDDHSGYGLYFHKNAGDVEYWVARSRYYAQSRAPLRSDIPCLLYAEVPSDALVLNTNGYEWMLNVSQRERIQNIRLEILPLTFSLVDE